MCLDVLLHMSERWKLAKNCHAVLSDLAEAIQEMEHTAKRPAFEVSDSTFDSVQSGRDSVSSAMNYPSDSRKRARLDTESNPSSSQRNDGSGQPLNQIPADIVNVSMGEPLGSSFEPIDATDAAIEDDIQYFGDPGRLSNWESGMPDLLAGITWESLLGGINEDDPTWDSAFF